MTRLTMEALETLAFAKRRVIEIDDELGIAILTIGREKFYASLPATPAWVAPEAS
jgi:hypothetical protein